MATYTCPRCQGTEIYFAKRERMTGLGGIYGNRSKMVRTPLCKACAEHVENDVSDNLFVFKVIGIVSIFVLAFLLILVLATLATS